VSRERRETEVCLVLRVRLEPREIPVLVALLVPWVPLVLLVYLVLKVLRVQRDQAAQLVRRETLVTSDLLDLLDPRARSSSPCPSVPPRASARRTTRETNP